jgi:thioredoxin-dependent peroxiredoxin
LRDAFPRFEGLDAVILGVSPQDARSHRKFRTKHDLPFHLVADVDHAIADAYGVWVEKSMYGRKYWGFERSTFVIGPDGKVEKVFRKVKPAQHDDLVLGALSD